MAELQEWSSSQVVLYCLRKLISISISARTSDIRPPQCSRNSVQQLSASLRLKKNKYSHTNRVVLVKHKPSFGEYFKALISGAIQNQQYLVLVLFFLRQHFEITSGRQTLCTVK